jgi:hypothetical protein
MPPSCLRGRVRDQEEQGSKGKLDQFRQMDRLFWQLNPSATIKVSDGAFRTPAATRVPTAWDGVFTLLETKRTGFPRKPGMSRTDLLKANADIIRPAAEAVKQHAPVETRWLIARSLALQEFAEEKRLPPQPVGARIGGKEIAQLVAKHRRATGFQHHNRPARVDLGPQHLENPLQIFLRLTQQAELIGPPAADVRGRQLDRAARRLEHALRCDRGLRPEVIVERVCP